MAGETGRAGRAGRTGKAGKAGKAERGDGGKAGEEDKIRGKNGMEGEIESAWPNTTCPA